MYWNKIHALWWAVFLAVVVLMNAGQSTFLHASWQSRKSCWRIRGPRYKYQHCYLVAVWSQANNLTSLSCKIIKYHLLSYNWIIGFVINEGEDVGKVDPGIFISSIIPGGPAEKAKKIKPGMSFLIARDAALRNCSFSFPWWDYWDVLFFQEGRY